MARKTFRPHPGEATTRRRGTSSTATGSRPASTLSVAFSPLFASEIRAAF
uniref:Uncharacterized protein n=1 Tax=Setaria viridis TaxID=4556 RepID=A0A4U6UNN7_SETVI|nr:hypothetical protein SEVIR_5G402801v2 [Setaria viridis]